MKCELGHLTHKKQSAAIRKVKKQGKSIIAIGIIFACKLLIEWITSFGFQK